MGKKSRRGGVRINKGPVQLTTRTTRAGETRKLGTKNEDREPTAETTFTSAGAAPPRPARARAGARSRAPSGAGGPPALMKAPAPARRRSRAPARAPGAARVSASSFRASAARRRAPLAPPQVTRGRPRRASREGPGRGRGRACVFHDSWSRDVGHGRGATDASAGGSSAQHRSKEATAAAARPCGKGPGDFAFDGVRAAAGRARKAARSDCASGATSAGVTLGGSGAAVRARLGGGTSAMTKAPEHEMGQCITRLAPGGGPDAPGQHTVVAACCGGCDGNDLRVRSAADGKEFGCL